MQLGVAGQRHRDDDALLHAAGELVGILDIALARNADHLQHVAGLFHSGLFVVIVVQQQDLQDLIAHGHQGVERGHRVLEDHRGLFAAEGAHLVFTSGQHVLAFDEDLAAGDLRRHVRQDTHDGLGDRGLARAGLAHEAQGTALFQREAHAVDGVDGLAVLGIDDGQVFYFKKAHVPASFQSLSFGSSASRRPSPSRFSASTVSAMATPGTVIRCGKLRI